MHERKQEEIHVNRLRCEHNPTSTLGDLAVIFIDTVVRCSSSSLTRGLVYLCLRLITEAVTE